MIYVYGGRQSGFATDVTVAALARSVTSGLVQRAERSAPAVTGIHVFVCPDADDAPRMAELAEARCKIMVFGPVPTDVAKLCGLKDAAPLSQEWQEAANSEPAPAYGTAQSSAKVQWSDHPLATVTPFSSRPFLRFDYANEWNNLGYGRITADGDIWSIAQEVTEDVGVHVLARAIDGRGAQTPFVTLTEKSNSSILWWNRPVGPVDSAEWLVVEVFLSDWRCEDLPCVPVISEIPWGYDGALTMRLDCDEDIASARPLFELYRARGLPFSLAIKTEQEDREEHVALLKEVLATGGAVLSHSVSHAPRWGGSLEACEAEARGSLQWLEERLPGVKIRHAVSPFHQNPFYVPEGLRRAGLNGFVGGIVANDPEMLLARGGHVPGDESGVVTHSQQCMMHGECVLADGDRLAVTKQAFLNALQSETLFGYLDHPFSPRYDYDWGSEEHRLDCHSEFLDFISAQNRKLKWMNEDEALDWIDAKANLVLKSVDHGYRLEYGSTTSLPFGVRYKGKRLALAELVHG